MVLWMIVHVEEEGWDTAERRCDGIIYLCLSSFTSNNPPPHDTAEPVPALRLPGVTAWFFSLSSMFLSLAGLDNHVSRLEVFLFLTRAKGKQAFSICKRLSATWRKCSENRHSCILNYV